MTRAYLALAVMLALVAWPVAPVRAQDFAPALPAGPQPGAAALLERALPSGPDGWTLETAATRWLALTNLETRAVALGAGFGPVRAGAGLSQTGDPELGWTSVAVALGTCARDGGVALRAIGRRDRAAGAVLAGDLARDAGIEAGAGAWLAPTPALVLWASAPQLYTEGASPPLARPLEMGARLSAGELAAWGAIVAPDAGDDGERVAGMSLALGAAAAWAEARDGPLRASVGVRIDWRGVRVESRADLHPVLGETTRIVLAWHLPGAEGRP